MKRGFLLPKNSKETGRQGRGAHTFTKSSGDSVSTAPPLPGPRERTADAAIVAEPAHATDSTGGIFIELLTTSGAMGTTPLSALINSMGMNPSAVNHAVLESAAVIKSGIKVVDWATFVRSLSNTSDPALPPTSAPLLLDSSSAPRNYTSCCLPFVAPRDRYTPAQLAEGETSCMLLDGVKGYFLSLPSFPHRLAISPSERKFRIGTSALTDAGLGMFATANFAVGDIILDERPLLIVPRAMPSINDFVRQGLSRMTERSRAAYLSLANIKGNTCAPEVGILRTNGFGFTLPGFGATFIAILEHTSRCNHSCTPNAISSGNLPSFSFQLRACRPIRSGEEITVPYTELHVNRAVRLEDLRTKYSFDCKCPSCSLSDKDSKEDDEARAIIAYAGHKGLRESFDEWLDDAKTRAIHNCTFIVNALRIMGLIEKTKVCDPARVSSVIRPLVEAYLALGDKKNAQEWARKGEMWMSILPYKFRTVAWRDWIERPEQSPLWRRRA